MWAMMISDEGDFRDIRIDGVPVTPGNASTFFDVNTFVEGFTVEE